MLTSQHIVDGIPPRGEASHHFGRFCAGQFTAAGKVEPAKAPKMGDLWAKKKPVGLEGDG